MKKDLRESGDLFKITYSDGATSYHRANHKHNYSPESFVKNLISTYKGRIKKQQYVHETLIRVFNDKDLICEKIFSGSIQDVIDYKVQAVANDDNAIDKFVSRTMYGHKKAQRTVPKNKSKILKSKDAEILYVDKYWAKNHGLNKYLLVDSICPLNSNYLEVTCNLERI